MVAIQAIKVLMFWGIGTLRAITPVYLSNEYRQACRRLLLELFGVFERRTHILAPKVFARHNNGAILSILLLRYNIFDSLGSHRHL